MSETSNPSETLVTLMTRYQSDLFRYIYSMVLNRHTAEDILQEAHLSIYRSADSFQADAHYLPWARTIAYRRVMDFRRQHKQGLVALSDEVLAIIAGSPDHPASSRSESDEAEALEQCSKKLPARHQDLLKARYADQIPVKQIAADQNRLVAA